MKCPTCNKPVESGGDNPYSPFCNERCKLIDLGKWLEEKYVINDPSTPSEKPTENDID